MRPQNDDESAAALPGVCVRLVEMVTRELRRLAFLQDCSTCIKIAVACGGTLKQLCPDLETGRLSTLVFVDVFGAICSPAQGFPSAPALDQASPALVPSDVGGHAAALSSLKHGCLLATALQIRPSAAGSAGAA